MKHILKGERILYFQDNKNPCTYGIFNSLHPMLCRLLIFFFQFFFLFFFFLKISFRNTIRTSNSLDPDQARKNVGPDLDQTICEGYQQSISGANDRKCRVFKVREYISI